MTLYSARPALVICLISAALFSNWAFSCDDQDVATGMFNVSLALREYEKLKFLNDAEAPLNAAQQNTFQRWKETGTEPILKIYAHFANVVLQNSTFDPTRATFQMLLGYKKAVEWIDEQTQKDPQPEVASALKVEIANDADKYLRKFITTLDKRCNDLGPARSFFGKIGLNPTQFTGCLSDSQSKDENSCGHKIHCKEVMDIGSGGIHPTNLSYTLSCPKPKYGACPSIQNCGSADIEGSSVKIND